MTEVKRVIKTWRYYKLLRYISKYKERGYTYKKIYKDWLFRKCVIMVKEVENG